MRLSYHPDAEAEVVEAARFHELKVQGLGDRFLREFTAVIAEIQEAPDRWKAVENGVRRHLMRSFPYGIYYRLKEDEIRILVLKHHSRHPDYWKYRDN